ncbi:MAG: hypothetical protein ABEJ02_02950 [Candidatus Paceibacteria bacterium]
MGYETNDIIDGFLDALNLFGGIALAFQASSFTLQVVAAIIAGGGFYRSINRKDIEEVDAS